MTVKIGLALGSGAARGWAHIGVIRALKEHGIEADVVSGCSIGSIVGAAYAASRLDSLETWITSLGRLDLAKYASLGSGFVNTHRLNDDFAEHMFPEGTLIESLDKPFGAVATDLETGREVWFTAGDALTAVWSSISIPGVFPSVRHDGRWLVDGGLVNPVPVSMCRSLGADVVIAVELNSDIVGKRSRKNNKQASARENTTIESNHTDTKDDQQDDLLGTLKGTIREYSSSLFSDSQKDETPKAPSFYETIASSVNIMQDRIARSRMAGDPPEILLSPRLSHIGLVEFHRAEEVIQLGYDLTVQQVSSIKAVIE